MPWMVFQPWRLYRRVFSAAIDSATITPAAVRMFEVTLSSFAQAVVSMTSELAFGVDFVAALSSVDPTNQNAGLFCR